jgi:Zn-dependent peptidase ImmA (M78 family)
MAIEIKIDLMALSDIGGQPLKLAAEIHRQLRLAHGDVPLPLPLSELATAVGIKQIEKRDTDAFEGALITDADKTKGIIAVRNGMTLGRTRFTIGHELGHFLNPFHREHSGTFHCKITAMNARRDDGQKWNERSVGNRIEIEANEFSLSLLVPTPEFIRMRKTLGDSDITHVVTLADQFEVSKEVMARLYVNGAPDKIGIITSKDGCAKNFILPREFPYLGMNKGMPLPSLSFAQDFLASAKPGATSELSEVRTDIWLDCQGNVTALYEQTLAQRDGWALTMLMIEEEAEDSEDEDDSNWNRRLK